MTLRELIEMAVGRLRSEWERAAQISYVTACAFGGGKNLKYSDLNPFAGDPGKKDGIEFEENVEHFRELFLR